MSYKVAVASSDGKFVNQHFGRTRQFLVFEIKDDGQFEFIALRDNTPPCDDGTHNDDLLARTVDLVSDCRSVLVSRIGPGAIDALVSRGVRPYAIPDFIEDAIKRLILLRSKDVNS